jgi:transposase
MGDITKYIGMEKGALVNRILTLEENVEQLKKELAKYKNPNTPSSSNQNLKENTRGKKAKKGAKRGAPAGHKGITRILKALKKIIVDANKCPKCDSPNLKDKKVLKRTVIDIPKKVKPEIVEADIHVKECKDCGYVFVPKQNTIPLKGDYGIELMLLVVFIKFTLRGVLRKTAHFLDYRHNLDITAASVNAIIKRVADAAESEYNEIKQRIRAAKTVYVDETSFSVLGDRYWVWVFKSADDILLVIRPSRGSNVLREILGDNYAGNVVCDCWSSYNFLSKAYANLQRCWAHLLRKSEVLVDTVAGKHFHEKLQELFKEIKEFNAQNPTDEQRLKKYEEMTEKLRKLTSYYSRYKDLMPVVKYINNKMGQWFTCVKIEGIEPTNNFAEQAIRETVMVRKIIGAFRSETGKQNYEILASLISTWQMKDKDIADELRQMMIKNMCFC